MELTLTPFEEHASAPSAAREDLPRTTLCVLCGTRPATHNGANIRVSVRGRQRGVALCRPCQDYAEAHALQVVLALSAADLKECNRCGLTFLPGECLEGQHWTVSGAYHRDDYLAVCPRCAEHVRGNADDIEVCSVCDGDGELHGKRSDYECPECDGVGLVPV